MTYLLVFVTLWYLFVRAGARAPGDVSAGDVVHGIVGLPGAGKTYKLTEGVLWSLQVAARRDAARARARARGVPENRLPRQVYVHANFEVGRRWPCHLSGPAKIPESVAIVGRASVVPDPCFSRSCKLEHVPVFIPYGRVQVYRKLSELIAIRARQDRWTRVPLEEHYVYADEVQLLASSREWHDTARATLAYFSQVRRRGVVFVWCSQDKLNVETGLRRVTGSVTKCKKVGPWLITKDYQLLLLENPEEESHALWHTLRIRRFRWSIATAFESYVDVETERDVTRKAPVPA